jgi:hypothetical protein
MVVELPAPNPPAPLKPKQPVPPSLHTPVALSHPTETSTWNGAAIAAADDRPTTAANAVIAISALEVLIAGSDPPLRAELGTTEQKLGQVQGVVFSDT